MSKDRNQTVRKSVEVDTDLDRWYKETYPGTSLWWFINALLRAFKDRHNPKEKSLLHDTLGEATDEVFPDK